MALIFISHSSKDNEISKEIMETLKKEGFDSVFLDHDKEKGIKIGEDWEKRLYEELERANAIMILLSPNWIESKWCFAEYTQARALGKEIIPVIIDHGANNEVDKWISSSIQNSDLTIDKADVLERTINRIKEIALQVQGGFEWDKNRSPYPGLSPFEEEDAAIYFGRDDDIKKIIEKLNSMINRGSPKLLNIVASSGFGKSSLLKAGILPRLKRSYKDKWIVLPTLKPSKRPLFEFSILVAKFLKQKNRYKEIFNALNSSDFKNYADELLTDIEFSSDSDKTMQILLPIDQAEEFFTISDKEEQKRFFEILNYLLQEKENFFTIWTMRADFLNYFQNDKTISSLQKKNLTELNSLSPMGKENIASIIVKPAKIANITIEEELVEKLKEDMQSTQALPLLAITLEKLYKDYAKDKKITLSDYKLLGNGADNPLETIVQLKADEALGSDLQDEKKMQILKDAFIPHLIQISPLQEGFVKKSAKLSELPAKANEMIEKLVKERLLIKKQNEIEIAHEALITN